MPYNENTANEILDLIESGITLTEITSIDGMPSKPTINKWMMENPEFANRYAHARKMMADTLADRVLIEAMNSHDAQIGRLRMDALKWTASKLAPKKYGDKIEIDSQSQQNFTLSFSVPDRLQDSAALPALPTVPAPQIIDIAANPETLPE